MSVAESLAIGLPLAVLGVPVAIFAVAFIKGFVDAAWDDLVCGNRPRDEEDEA